MTPWDLQKSLIAEIEELLAQMQLKMLQERTCSE